MNMKGFDEETLLIDKIVALLHKEDKFIITTHYNIDGDGLGSEIALYILLKKLGKKVEIVNQDKTPEIYKFLPYVKDIRDTPSEYLAEPNVSIVLDCGTLKRAGKISSIVKKTPIILNIDHHFSNIGFGTINFVGVGYSSTGEMVLKILERYGELSKKQAICLYTSIITDTGSFIYNIGKNTLMSVQKLIETGISPEEISRKIYMQKPLKSVKLLTLALETLDYNLKEKVCWMYVDKKMYEATKTRAENTEGFVEMLQSIKGFKVVFLLKEDKSIKISLRSKEGYDVERVARKFGGGGHKQAAGCELKNSSISESISKMFTEIKKYNERNNSSK